MNRLAAATLFAATLVGCATAQPTAPVSGGNGPVCRNTALDQFVGKPASAELGAQIMRVSGARNLQWIQPGMMVTMDFREDRVRVSLDEQNKVQKVSCG